MNQVLTYSKTLTIALAVFAVATLSFSATAFADEPSCDISADPSGFDYDDPEPVLIEWESDDAVTAFLSHAGSVPTDGERTFYPTFTTTYALTVYSSDGESDECEVTVEVENDDEGDLSCWITLTPRYGYGSGYNNQEATLSWDSNNAESARISPSIGSVGTEGSRTVYTDGYVQYTLTVYEDDDEEGDSEVCRTVQYDQSYYPSYHMQYNLPAQAGQPYSQYPYPSGNLSCAINANPTTTPNGQAMYLSWTSQGAFSATLSDGIGTVGINGTLTVRPESSRTYTLTVRDYQGRTQACSTQITVSGSAPYVGLSQIPYTGFDFGPIGNALYWMAMIGFAIASGYLVVYYLPALRTRQAGLPGRASFANGARNRTTSAVQNVENMSYDIEIPALFRSEEGRADNGSLENLPVYPGNNFSLGR